MREGERVLVTYMYYSSMLKKYKIQWSKSEKRERDVCLSAIQLNFHTRLREKEKRDRK